MGKPGPTPDVTLEDVLHVFDERDDPTEPLTAPEIAEILGCSRRTVLEKLHTLEDQSTLRGKTVGSRAVVWWRPDAATDEEVAPAEPLRQIVGILGDDAADRAEERSREWREEFNQQMDGKSS
ncbi:HTH domain-containing protein [Natronolimnobius sp. AArcel1]|uniref:HTH domain-containing protein n=1 Tax=Natronolimnobius sp. AArcel1 TaxID=1679093 RepID=UPI0013EBCB0C|nr:HTH domain-containing protein [Natronolimnobius sp. AArcel1]NGM71450.1 HTH domain-containing protein [Natronolimnobius sp. AArcel1]